MDKATVERIKGLEVRVIKLEKHVEMNLSLLENMGERVKKMASIYRTIRDVAEKPKSNIKIIR